MYKRRVVLQRTVKMASFNELLRNFPILDLKYLSRRSNPNGNGSEGIIGAALKSNPFQVQDGFRLFKPEVPPVASVFYQRL